MKRLHTQTEWIERAKEVLPAGGFGNFDPGIIIREGHGSRVWDEDGNEYGWAEGIIIMETPEHLQRARLCPAMPGPRRHRGVFSLRPRRCGRRD